MKIEDLTYYFSRQALFAAILLAAVACLTSCSDTPERVEKTDSVRLRFSINLESLVPGGSGASRAPVMPGSTQPGTVPENFLDLSDISFVLFDGDRRMLEVLEPTVTPQAGSDFAIYDVECEILDPYFTNAQSVSIEFYILVLANYSQYSPQNLHFAYRQTLSDLFDLTHPSFATPQGSPWWYPRRETPDESSGITPQAPQYIPMAGLQHYSIPTGTLSQQKIVLPDDIYMLRSMAKIEVIDRINATGKGAATMQPDVDKRVSLKSVELMGYYTQGTLLPEFSSWTTGRYPETQYVTSPFVPSFSYLNPPPYSARTPGSTGAWSRPFGYDAAATAARTDGCRVYSVYLPEYAIPDPDQPLAAGSATDSELTNAWMRVTVHNPDGTADAPDVTFGLRLSEYVDGKAEGDDIPLLRNNIYRYEITDVSTTLVNVVWTVCPMSTAEIEIPPFE